MMLTHHTAVKYHFKSVSLRVSTYYIGQYILRLSNLCHQMKISN